MSFVLCLIIVFVGLNTGTNSLRSMDESSTGPQKILQLLGISIPLKQEGPSTSTLVANHQEDDVNLTSQGGGFSVVALKEVEISLNENGMSNPKIGKNGVAGDADASSVSSEDDAEMGIAAADNLIE